MTGSTKSPRVTKPNLSVTQGVRRALKFFSRGLVYILIGVTSFVAVLVILNVAQDLWVNR